MTENEAIKELRAQIETAESIISYNTDFEPEHDNSVLKNKIKTAEMGISALEKQIPKKIIFNSEDDREYEDYICPNCKDILQQRRKGAKRITIYKFKFCHNCGQKLDWSDTD